MTVQAGDSPEILLAARPPRPRSRASISSKLLASIVDSSDDAIIGKTLDGVITAWNSSAQRMYGYQAEEIIGHSVSLLIPSGLPDEMDEILNRIRVGKRVDHYETRRRRKDGAIITVSLTVSPIHDASGKVVGASAIARDITGRKRVRDQARLASQYARGLIEASRDPLVTIGLEGKITEVNEATTQMTGAARADLVGTDFSDCFTEPDLAREGYRQVLGQGFVTDYPLTIRHVGGELTEVLYNASVYRDADGQPLGVFAAVRDVTDANRLRRELSETKSLLDSILQSTKDGSKFTVTAVVTRRDDTLGHPVGFLLMSEDISEKKLAEDQLRSASQYARSLIEASRDPLVTIDALGKITDVNEATSRVTGVARGDLVGTDFSDCFTEPDLAREGYLRVFAQGFVTDYPLTIRHTDGELTEVLYNASVYRDTAGRVLGVFAAAGDVTARKRAESEVTKQQARELDRLAELERFQQLTVGRELRMIELKNEIEHLRAAARSTSRDTAGGT